MCHLEPVVHFEIRKMRFDHAKQSAAIIIGWNLAAEAYTGFAARRRPNIYIGLL